MSEFSPSDLEQKESLPKYRTVIVAPGFEADTHRMGLHWDTRLRLLAAAIYAEQGMAEKIVGGGGRIRNMQESFSTLMKRVLVDRYGVSESAIDTEENTFDTASQVEWLKQHINDYQGSIAFITDIEQGKHIKALLNGYELPQVGILSTEAIIESLAPKSKYARFLRKLHNSPYWLKWKAREGILTALTKTVDPRGKQMRRITKGRLKLGD